MHVFEAKPEPKSAGRRPEAPVEQTVVRRAIPVAPDHLSDASGPGGPTGDTITRIRRRTPAPEQLPEVSVLAAPTGGTVGRIRRRMSAPGHLPAASEPGSPTGDAVTRILRRTPAPDGQVIQRRIASHPLAVALDFEDTWAARQALGEQSFQALNGVQPMNLLSPVLTGPAAIPHLQQLTNNQQFDSARIAAVVTQLHPLLSLPGIAALSHLEAGYHLQHVAHHAAALRALLANAGHVPTATTVMTFLQPFLADANQLTNAERVVAARANNVVAAASEMRWLAAFQWSMIAVARIIANQHDDATRIDDMLQHLLPALGEARSAALTSDQAAFLLRHVAHVAAADRVLQMLATDNAKLADDLMHFLAPYLPVTAHLANGERVLAANALDLKASAHELGLLARFGWNEVTIAKLKQGLGVVRFGALTTELSTYFVAHLGHIDAALRALTSNGDDIGVATSAMGVLGPYLADASHIAQAEAVVASCNRDFVQAAADLRRLARFQWDAALLAVAGTHGDAVAERHVEDRKQTVKQGHATAVASIDVPTEPEGKKRNPTSVSRYKKAKTAYDIQIEPHVTALAKAEQQAESERKPTRTAYVDAAGDFLADPVVLACAGPLGARWIAELVGFEAAPARTLASIFTAVGDAARPSAAVLWSLCAGDRPELLAGTMRLLAARSGGLDETTACDVAVTCLSLPGWASDATANQLAAERQAHPGDWKAVVEFVGIHGGSSPAFTCLQLARGAGWAVDDLTFWSGKVNVAQIAQLLPLCGISRIKREAALDLVTDATVTGGSTLSLTTLLGLAEADVALLLPSIRFNSMPLGTIDQIIALATTAAYPMATVAVWLSGYKAINTLGALTATAFHPFTAFVDEFLAFTMFGNSDQMLQLVRLQACLKAGIGGQVTTTQLDTRYQFNDDKRTGFLHFTPPHGAQIVIHTHWNRIAMDGVKAFTITSMHIQIASSNGPEVNKYKYFGVVQQAILVAHNAGQRTDANLLTFTPPTS